MKISAIIPVYNEAENIGTLIAFILQHGGGSLAEVLVVDAGSQDDTIAIARNAGATVIVSPQKGRAAQMNYGASIATGDVFYFIHADTLPPASFSADIRNTLSHGYDLGRYRTRFNSTRMILRLNAFFTRFDLFVCYGGDQTLFIKRTLFESIWGFDAAMHIMEDYDIVRRARQKGKYSIIPKTVLVSARKYDTNSWWRVQHANYTIVKMFKQGASQEAMIKRYKELLDYR